MSTTCSTFDAEVLSAFLDAELADEEATEVSAHLEHCVPCRQRLEGLGRVSNSLRGLERVAPPPILDELVLGQLEVGAARSWSRRLDQFAAPSQRTRATIGPMFALVMMLVLLVFLFGEALERRGSQPTVISLPAMPSPPVIEIGTGARFVEVGGAQWDDFRRANRVAQVLVEEAVAEHFALSHGPGPAASMMLISELEHCSAASAAESERFSELKAPSITGDPVGAVLVVIRSGAEVRCVTL